MARLAKKAAVALLLPLVILVGVRCGGGGGDQISGPPAPTVERFSVSITTSAGVNSTPASGTQQVVKGGVLTYSFSAASGYDNLRVFLDTVEVASSGSFAVDRNRTLAATVSSVIALPQSAGPIANALQSLLSASNPMPALRDLDRQFSVLSDATDPVTAVQQLQIAQAKSYDPIADAPRIAATLLQISDSLAAQDAAASQTAEFRASRQSSVGQTAPVTTIYYVNGIRTDLSATTSTLSLIRSLLTSTAYADNNKYPVISSYNQTWKYSLSKDGLTTLVCLQGVANQVRQGLISALPNMRKCFAFSVGDIPFTADLPEAFLQFINVSYGSFPSSAQPDAVTLAGRVAAGLSNNGRVVIVAHSQGNLMAAEALKILRAGSSASSLKCLGIIGIAPPTPTPIAGSPVIKAELFAEGQQSKDLLLKIPPIQAANLSTPKLANGTTVAWDPAIASEWIWKTLFKWAAGYDIHGIDASYLGQLETRAWARTALTQTLASLEVACPLDTGGSQSPTISLSANSAAFSAVAGGSNPASQSTTQVTNSGTGTLSGVTVGTISYGSGAAGWLTASLSGTTAPATLTLTAATGSLPAGTYTANVPIASSATGVTNSPQNVTVTFNVSAAPAPTIALSSTAISFSATAGGSNPSAQSVQITNGGTGTLSGLAGNVTYQAGQPSGWLAASLSATTAPATLAITPTTGTLAAGTYSATVAISSGATGVTNSPQSISVTFTVAGVSTGFQLQSIGTGLSHTCALTTSGAAYCWGKGGLLGDGTTSDRSTPTAVAGGLTFGFLAVGSSHSCGLVTGGAAFCWGNNSTGGLGDGTTITRLTPAAVAGGLTFASLAAGYDHTCALTPAGTAYCWGYNFAGELGDGTTTNRSAPVLVAGGRTFQSLAAGTGFTCGITTSGAAYCWGYNQRGQLGDGTTTSRFVPVAVSGAVSFAKVSAGYDHVCGLDSADAAYCWGANKFYLSTQSPVLSGKLGDGTAIDRLTPVQVLGGLKFAGVSAGTPAHTCGVTTSNVAYCWGYRFLGSLGNGSDDNTGQLTPTSVSGGLAFRSVSAGEFFSCGVTTSNAAYCWGSNAYGKLGDGTTTNRTTPVAVKPP